MNNSKIDVSLDIDSQNIWEVIVKYSGDIDKIGENLGVEVEKLLAGYAIVTLPADKVRQLAMQPGIDYIEKPRRLSLFLENALLNSCIPPVIRENGLTGQGVIVGIIDSGIDYTNDVFRNEAGETRIIYLWDQSGEGIPPEGFNEGAEFTREDINNALRENRIIHRDFNGHGTAVTSIAAGNNSVARESEIIVVSLGERGRQSFARSTELMRALKYILDKAIELNMPVAINISFGTNDGSHDGKSIFETYIEDITGVWKNSIIVSAGNEGISSHHYRGRVLTGEEDNIEINIAGGLDDVQMYFWKSSVDTMSIELISPNGTSTGRISASTQTNRFTVGSTVVNILFGEATPYNGDTEIFIEINSDNTIPQGLWNLIVYGDSIIEGSFDIWLPVTEIVTDNTFFLNSDADDTVTIPSTVENVITVGSYNSDLNTVSDFSGRGYTRNNMIKPDIVAPGVDIVTVNNTGSVSSFTGTSFASPFVTGSAALLMEWGIVQGNDENMYGQKLKSYLLRGANRRNDLIFPNNLWGFGSLCLENSFDELTQRITVAEVNNIVNIEDIVFSNDYFSFLVENNFKNSEIISQNPDIVPYCKVINQRYLIVYIRKFIVDNLFFDRDIDLVNEGAFLLGLADIEALNASGIIQVQNQPFLNLTGNGVLIAIIDTGIDYTNEAFIFEDGTSKIVSLWDQSIRNGNIPEGQCYGSEYTREDINEALKNDNPLSIVPSVDEIGHGTNLALLSSGRGTEENLGAAPDSELVIVKLKRANDSLLENRIGRTNVIGYNSNDLVTAINYVTSIAKREEKPIAICIGLQTNEGGHTGSSLLNRYLTDIAVANGVVMIIASGNEATARHHSMLELNSENTRGNFEIRVGENEQDFEVNIWSYVGDRIRLRVISPLGEETQEILPTLNFFQRYSLVLGNSEVIVNYFFSANSNTSQLYQIRFVNPTSGLWTIDVTADVVLAGPIHAYLPLTGFIEEDTFFVVSEPFYTVNELATSQNVLATGGYNSIDNSVFPQSGRGPTRLGLLKPLLSAPAFNLNGSLSGTSYGAAISTGAAALLLQWGIVRGNDTTINSTSAAAYLITGTEKREGEVYPNNIWGFGSLNLYNSFENL